MTKMSRTQPTRPAAHPRPGGEAENGQALVEMALMAVILMILLSFLLDIGRAYYSYQALKDAAGEGAYYGSVHPTWTDAPPCEDKDTISYRVRHAAPSGGLVDLTAASVNVSAPAVSAGNFITVTATTNFQLIAPFTGMLIGTQTLQLKAVSSARILAPATACGE